MHVILQTGSQLHAHRLKLYLSSPQLQAFPASKGFDHHAAEELGARDSDHHGPCLVLLSDCRVSPRDLKRHILSTFLRGYVVRVYWIQHTTPARAACIAYLKLLLKRQESPLRSREPFRHDGKDDSADGAFFQSLGPPHPKSQCTSQCSNGAVPEQSAVHADCNSSKNAAERTRDRGVLIARLQTYPRDLEDSLIDEFPHVDCRPHGFSQSLYVVHVDGVYRSGVISGRHMYLAPPDREKLTKDSISRASMKLEEALYVLGFNLRSEMTAIDVGASPGAWTQLLSNHVKRVLAVDPAPLHSHALQANVTHFRMLAQDAVESISQCCNGPSVGVDLLVCDVNRHPVEASQIVLPLLPFVRQGGLLVLTLKFHGRGRHKVVKIEEIKRIFQEYLTDMDCIWLLGNSTFERTFVGKKM